MSISAPKRRKPSKPYPSFPLTPHNNGQWCKKVRGKIYFFGVWENPNAALEHYLRIAEDLHSGRQPRPTTISAEGLTVKELCNRYLTHQLQKAGTSEISARWFEDCRRVVSSFARSVGSNRLACDLAPIDFEQHRQKLVRRGLTGNRSGLGVHALNRAITIIKAVFKYAFENDLIDKPVKYGNAFQKPSATMKRKSRHAREQENGKRLLEPSELRSLINMADVPLRAMILLGINGGFGNTDCARLPLKAIDFGRALIEFDRPKTGIERVVSLWPETLEALHQSAEKRPKAINPEYDRLVFLTMFGQPWVREIIHRSGDNGIEKVVAQDAINHEFNKLLRRLKIKRKGVGFYALRHTFRTWADEVRDQHAIHRIMGHTIPGMSGIYVEEISLDRLRAVVNHVRSKLFGPAETSEPAASTAASAT